MFYRYEFPEFPFMFYIYVCVCIGIFLGKWYVFYYLSTCLLFISRNKQGEYLSNLLDQWEPTRHASGTFAEQRAKFSELLAAIRSRLGGMSYIYIYIKVSSDA